MKKKHYSLKQLALYAERHGYTVEIKYDHIIAKNENGCIRTGSMETLKRLAEEKK